MAYFSNSSEGDNFREECSSCKYGRKPCPIFLVQFTYNYEACNNKTAREILDDLISNNGVCSMKEMFKVNFFKDINQTEINL